MESFLWAAEAVAEVSWLLELSKLGASGASIAMLGYMLYQMPRHFREERESREKVAASHEGAVKAVLADGQAQAKYEREACERRHGELLEHIDRRHDEAQAERAETHTLVRQFRHEWAQVAQRQANRRAREDLERKKAGGGDREKTQ